MTGCKNISNKYHYYTKSSKEINEFTVVNKRTEDDECTDVLLTLVGQRLKSKVY